MLNLPYGPWKDVLTGSWGGINVTYYENPDKELLMTIFDKKADKIAGMVILLAKFFIPHGDTNRLIEKFSGNLVHVKKKTPNLLLDYLGLVTDPIYIEFDSKKIINKINKAYLALQDQARDMRKLAREYQIPVIELKNANEEVIHRLFGEPLALPTLIVRKPGQGTMLEMKVGKMKLGLKVTGEIAEEPVQNLGFTIISGESDKVTRVVIEEAILNGVTVVVFDKDGSFAAMRNPSQTTKDYEKFELSQPMGMPIRKMEPGIEVFIEPEFFDNKCWAEFLGLDKETSDVLNVIIKEKPETLKELMEKIENVKPKKFIHERLAMLVNYLNTFYGDLFREKSDGRELVAPWLKKIGRLTCVDVSGLEDNFRNAIMLSVVKAIERFLKSEMPSKELKSVSVVDISPNTGPLFTELKQTLKVLSANYGHGFVCRTNKENWVEDDMLQASTLRIVGVNENESIIISRGKKPYRIHVRPTLSSFEKASHQ